jgi:hypothetical protein
LKIGLILKEASMSRKRLNLSILTMLVLLLACSSLAHAQATRTWVSGVGDDANPCSRTAPCKTFAGAISKTAPGGEINVLDPGGFGALTITKAITVSSEGSEGGVLVSGTNGFVVNVPNATDIVVIRGLDFEGLGTGLNGISVVTGGTVQVEKCTINHFIQNGISFTPTVAGSKLQVIDTIIRNNGSFPMPASGQGVLINPSAAAQASLDNVRLEGNVAGLKAQGSSTTSVSGSVAANNAFAGFSAGGSPAVLNIERSVSANNGTGIVCAVGTTVRIGNTSISGNPTPVTPMNTCLFSFKNNDIDTPSVAVSPVNPQ